MNQAMALPGMNFSTSDCVNVLDVDWTRKAKTEPSKPLKTKNADYSVQGQSKAKQEVSLDTWPEEENYRDCSVPISEYQCIEKW